MAGKGNRDLRAPHRRVLCRLRKDPPADPDLQDASFLNSADLLDGYCAKSVWQISSPPS
jgi:hypothetical protein